MQILREFKAFVVRGNVVDLAVGIVVGSAFTSVVTAFVADVLTPLISIPGKANFASWAFSIHHSVFYYGRFLNALISFLLVSTAVFFAVVKPLNTMASRLRSKPQTLTTKVCSQCLSIIALQATRCAYCTSHLEPATCEKPPSPEDTTLG